MPRNNRQYPTIEELRARTKINGDCWEWTGDHTRSGYGRIMRTLNNEQVTLRVHRISFEHFHGHIGEGLSVLHKCDNPPCWNPDHLFQGTQAENMKDKKCKGRAHYGERVSRIFSTTQAASIIARAATGETAAQIARSIGGKRETVRDIITGKSWIYADRPIAPPTDKGEQP